MVCEEKIYLPNRIRLEGWRGEKVGTCVSIVKFGVYAHVLIHHIHSKSGQGGRPLPEMLALFFAFLKDLALEFAFSHFSGICTKNRIFRLLSQLPILFLCGSTCFGWHSYL